MRIRSVTDTRDHVQPVHRCALRERFMEECYTVRVEALDSDPECKNTLYWGGSDHDSPPLCKVRSMTCFNRVKCHIEWREKTFYLKDCATWMRFMYVRKARHTPTDGTRWAPQAHHDRVTRSASEPYPRLHGNIDKVKVKVCAVRRFATHSEITPRYHHALRISHA